jgi:CBS domain containing-hemolysin-like protein
MGSRAHEPRAQEPPPATSRRRLFHRVRGKAGPGEGRTATAENGRAQEQERLILEALVDLRDMEVREVMTPRVDVIALSIPVRAEDVARAVRESGHSCFPVVNGDLDDLVGVLFVNDLFRKGRLSDWESQTLPSPMEVSRRLRAPYVIPESLGVLEALADMRRQRRAFAMVVDEYGGMAGVLTVKDLLEPLVGDLRDEFDEGDEAEIVRVDRTRWLLDGRVSVDEVRERLGMDLADGEYVTLGGFLFDRFGHIPLEGEQVDVGDWELKVVEMDKRRVARVVARHNGPSEAGDDLGPDVGRDDALPERAERHEDLASAPTAWEAREPASGPGRADAGTGGEPVERSG